MVFPNLSGVVDPKSMTTKGTGSYAADYVNWSRTMQYLRDHAPDWLPEMVQDQHGNDVHTAPNGSGYLMIRFVNVAEHLTTPAVPHAIMDNKMTAKTVIHSRDVSDAFVRGVCKAAALMFGLAWQMWSKDDPLTRTESSDNTNDSVSVGGSSATVNKVVNAIGTASTGRQLTDYARRISDMSKSGELSAAEAQECITTLGGKVVELDLPKTAQDRIKAILTA